MICYLVVIPSGYRHSVCKVIFETKSILEQTFYIYFENTLRLSIYYYVKFMANVHKNGYKKVTLLSLNTSDTKFSFVCVSFPVSDKKINCLSK